MLKLHFKTAKCYTLILFTKILYVEIYFINMEMFMTSLREDREGRAYIV